MAKGGMAPRPMVPTMVICCPWLNCTKCVNMVCIVTPAVISPSATYIGFLHVLLRTPFNRTSTQFKPSNLFFYDCQWVSMNYRYTMAVIKYTYVPILLIYWPYIHTAYGSRSGRGYIQCRSCWYADPRHCLWGLGEGADPKLFGRIGTVCTPSIPYPNNSADGPILPILPTWAASGDSLEDRFCLHAGTHP